MTFPTTPVRDTFDRPDEGPPPSVSWTTPAGFDGLVVDAHQAASDPGGGGFGLGSWNASVGPNIEIYVRIPVRPNDGGNGITLYWIDATFNDGYCIIATRDDLGGDAVKIFRLDGGADTQIGGDYNINFQDGDGLGMRILNGVISAYHKPTGGDWTLLGSSIDATYQGSRFLMVSLDDTTARVDDFGGGNYITAVSAGLPSQHESTGLSIAYADPLVKAGRSALMHRLTGALSTWSHESRRVGGYWSASLSMADREEGINDWIQNGIGRHVEAHNPALEVVWEGFVNEISVRQGEDSYSVGPLLDIGNRISVTYSVIDTSTDPPTLGTRDTTAVANNADSQALYGIWHKIKSINGATATDATQMRDSFVNDPGRAYPAVTPVDFSLGGGGDMTVTLSLLGYWHWLKAYYPVVAATGDQNLSAKITAILTLSPNAIFSTNYLDVATNATQVGQSASGEQTAETIFKDLNSRGDASYNAYSIGFYAGRRLIYRAIPTEIEYQKRRGQPVLGKLDNPIRPWDVDPARWIFRPDFLVGRHPPITAATLGSDPRAGLIEVVKYSTPYGLSVNGQKVSQLDQMLARRGIGGMS